MEVTRDWKRTLPRLGLALLLPMLVLAFLHAALPWLASFDLDTQARAHGLARPWLTAVLLALTALGAIKVFLPGALAGLLLRGDRARGLVLCVALAGAFLLDNVSKPLFHRVRPAVAWKIGTEPTWSFPSGHALLSTTLYGTLLLLAWPRARGAGRRAAVLLPALLLPLLIGFSRVYLGQHWPTDVLGGWLAGGAWVLGVGWALRPRAVPADGTSS